MINLSTNRNLQLLADEWYRDLMSFLMEKRKGNERPRRKDNGNEWVFYDTRLKKYIYDLKRECKEKNVSNKEQQELFTYIRGFIRDFENNIKADKVRMEQLVAVQNGWKNKKVKDIIKECLVQVYEDFIRYQIPSTQTEIGYKYMERLNVRTCPYCNRQYTFTIRRERKGAFCTRPEFDHFYDKSDYPLLALTFFNLVPSCHECNHGKHTQHAGVNPYFESFSTKFSIQDKSEAPLNKNEILKVTCADDFTLGFDHPSDEERSNIQAFGLLRQYAEHRDYVQEIIEKYVTYDAVMEQGIPDAFQGTFRSSSDIRQFVWGKYLEEARYENRPLSKLTGDILDQLGIEKS